MTLQGNGLPACMHTIIETCGGRPEALAAAHEADRVD